MQHARAQLTGKVRGQTLRAVRDQTQEQGQTPQMPQMRGTDPADAIRGRTLRIRMWAVTVLLVVALLAAHGFASGPSHPLGNAPSAGTGALIAIFCAALLCEFMDSSLGMGYGTTLTPLLLVAGFEPLRIVPCVLLSEFLTGLAACLLHHRDGNIDLLRDREARGAAVTISLLSVIGAVAAVSLALRVPTAWLRGMIGGIVLLAGCVTLITLRCPPRYRPGHLYLLGAVAAFNKGLSGGGYGPLVTSGQVVSGLSPRKAVAVTSLAESLTCMVGLGAFLALDQDIDWTLAIPLTLGALLSVPLATLTVRALPDNALRVCVGTGTVLLGLLSLSCLLR